MSKFWHDISTISNDTFNPRAYDNVMHLVTHGIYHVNGGYYIDNKPLSDMCHFVGFPENLLLETEEELRDYKRKLLKNSSECPPPNDEFSIWQGDTMYDDTKKLIEWCGVEDRYYENDKTICYMTSKFRCQPYTCPQCQRRLCHNLVCKETDEVKEEGSIRWTSEKVQQEKRTIFKPVKKYVETTYKQSAYCTKANCFVSDGQHSEKCNRCHCKDSYSVSSFGVWAKINFVNRRAKRESGIWDYIGPMY